MKFEERHTFDRPAQTVMKMYTDRGFFDRKYEAIGALEYELLEHLDQADLFSVRYRLLLKSDAPVPEVARRFLGDTVRLVQLDRWDPAARTGRLEIDIKGAPIRIGADMRVVDEDGGGSVNIQSWSLVCGLPLVGSKIEAVLAQDIKVKSQRDLAASQVLIRDY